MPAVPTRLSVLGAGSWGTALAIQLARNGALVSLWGHDPTEIDALNRDRENTRYLPGVALPEGLEPVADLTASVREADEILVVVPSHAFSDVCAKLARLRPDLGALSWATKGFDHEAHELLSSVVRRHFPQCDMAVVSGPTFAREVARGLPTAITVASNNPRHAERVARYLHAGSFRAYTSDDLVGVQVGGAAKNVMAIAAGISDGLGFGANARAALITRGLHEITLLGLAMGGRPETFVGLAGLGDLALTCTDDQSRNRRMGLALARGLDIARARAEIGQEVEGIATAREVRFMARQYRVEMPITEQVHQVLFGGLDPRSAVQNLLSREPKAE
jgi:glycerol-3-phosphate dehydrogenase (NAD(P)+)